MYRECRDSAWSWIFLFIGILAALAMRLVALFMHTNQFYAKVSWYVGVSFFFVFFIYRYNVSNSRARAVREKDLVSKVVGDDKMGEEDRRVVSRILCGLTSKKERVNFITIFALSGITLAIAIIADIIKVMR